MSITDLGSIRFDYCLRILLVIFQRRNEPSHQRKLSFQLKPPHVMSDAVTYSNVSSEMTSMMGHTTVFL